MAGSVSIVPARLTVAPGAQGVASVRIRNTGAVVDQFSVTVLGAAAVWTTAVPAALSLFPGADGTIELHFAPPRTAEVEAGTVPFAVRVDASQDPDGSVVEEGEVDLLPFVDVQAKLTPRTSETKRKARHEVLVDNRGNAPVEVGIRATDPDEVLAFDVASKAVTVPAGQSVHVGVKVAARKGFLRGTDKHRPFQVGVEVGQGHPPINLDGTLVQQAGLPRFVVPLVGAAVVIALAALILPGLTGGGGSGKLSLTSDQAAATTTTVAVDPGAPADESVDPNAPATAEEQAAAAEAERLANGQDAASASGASGSGDGAGGTGGTTAAGTSTGSGDTGSTSGGTTAGGSTSGSTGTDGGATPVTAAPGTPPPGGTSTGGSTTTAPTTTAPPPPTETAPAGSTSKNFYGTWQTKDGGSMAIVFDRFSRAISVKVDAPFGAFTCSGSTADADDDGSFTGRCSDGFAHVFTHLGSTDQVNVTHPAPARTICPKTGCSTTFSRA